MTKKNEIFTPPQRNLLVFDVVDSVTDMFIETMRMPVNPLFVLNFSEVFAFVYQRRPTLQYRKIKIEIKDLY